jgi:hypothetical protein
MKYSATAKERNQMPINNWLYLFFGVAAAIWAMYYLITQPL